MIDWLIACMIMDMLDILLAFLGAQANNLI